MGITVLCTVMTYVILKFEKGSDAAIETAPIWVLFCAGLTSASVAYFFMRLPDTLADTIFYCFEIEQRRHAAVSRIGYIDALLSLEEEGVAPGWFCFPQAEYEDEEEDNGQMYAPRKLQEYMQQLG